jgi:hypothetical protein
MTGLNAPDSSSSGKYLAIRGSSLEIWRMTLRPRSSGVTSARCSVPQTAVTRAPRPFRSWTAAEPMAPVAPLTRTSCPLRALAFRIRASA